MAREKEEQEKKEREAKSRSLFRNLVYVKGPEEASDETSMAAVERLVASGEITAATLVWSEGMEAWYVKALFWHSRHSAKFCLLCTGRRWVTARIASPGRLGRRLRGFEEAIGESCVKCTMLSCSAELFMISRALPIPAAGQPEQRERHGRRPLSRGL